MDNWRVRSIFVGIIINKHVFRFGPSGIMEAPMVSQIVSQQISGKNILDKEFIDAALQEYSPLRPGCVTTLN